MKNSPTFMTEAQKELLKSICARADQNNGVAQYLSSELFNIESTSAKRSFMTMVNKGVKQGLWFVSYGHRDQQGVQLCKFTPRVRVTPFSAE